MEAARQVPWLGGVAIGLGALLLLLLAPATSSAARTEFFGIAQGGTLDGQDLGGMEAARVRTDRFMLEWRSIQPTSESRFRWGDSDQLIGRLASHRIRSVPFVWGSPEWVASAPNRPPIDTAAHERAWRNFLKAAVARYGRGGAYWGAPYHQQYGADAKPLPVMTWQIWNEPHLEKYFKPGGPAEQLPQKYGRLLHISHNAIESTDPDAQILLAGMLWGFLGDLYRVSAIKSDFDLASVHPYASDLAGVREEVGRFRNVMKNHGDGATALWITELAWGSDPPDRFGINKGLAGQEKMLRGAFELILERRQAWNVQRLFWYHWRDPEDNQASCSFCASAGLLKPDRTRKPAYYAFKGFTADTTPPVATITAGPRGFTKDPTPSFSFASNEDGSTFVCRFDAQPFKACSSPFTRASALADGSHTFVVKATDAPGNQSAPASRSFTVDTHAPAAPQITGTDPASPANDNSPKLKGSAAAGSTVKLYKTAGCTGSPAAQGSRVQFASPGITAAVADNTTTSFRATATDLAGNRSECSAARTYVEDSAAPQTTITSGPAGGSTTPDHTPTFGFSSSESGSTFRCRFDSQPFAACSGPGASHTPSSPLPDGPHTFQVRAIDRANNPDPTPAQRTFTVAP